MINRDNNEIKGFVLICSIQASMESIHDSLAEALVKLTEEVEFPFFSLCYTFWMINVYITLSSHMLILVQCEKLWSKVYVVWPKSRTRSIKTKAL